MQKAQKQELTVADAERLAKEALGLKKQLLQEASELEQQAVVHNQSAQEVHKNVEVLKFNISKWENELKLLKARVKVSDATKLVNKQLAKIDANSTISMLERMKEKVEENEALAMAYADLANGSKSVSDEIDKAIGTHNVDEELELLKQTNNSK